MLFSCRVDIIQELIFNLDYLKHFQTGLKNWVRLTSGASKRFHLATEKSALLSTVG